MTAIKVSAVGKTAILAVLLAVALPAQEPQATAPRDLFVTVGKSLVMDIAEGIQRVSVANSDLAEALVVTPREVLVNGKAPGETSLILWQQGGNRFIFDLNVRGSATALEAVRRELATELPGQEVSITVEQGNVFLRGTVKDLTSAERAASIAGTLGKIINLLNVNVPPTDGQILLRVKFANVDRAASTELGANLISTGAGNTLGGVTTGQFAPPTLTPGSTGASAFSLSDALNIFLFRADLNLAATIRALQTKRILDILAEPNLLTIDGKSASFLAGGEFPFPTVQGGANAGAVTIQWREFGIRITFLPTITPRGTIRLQVTPEVSALDFANGLSFQGTTIPALSTRRVQTEIELETGQSFAIGGLLDNRVTESWSKVPGLGDIPFFGKLFRSKARSKTNTELLIVVTPELVRPVPSSQPAPDIKMPLEPLEWGAKVMPRTPGTNVTGTSPARPTQESIPVEELIRSLQPAPAATAPSFVPNSSTPNPPQAQPSPTAPASPAPAPPKSAISGAAS
jgi:pilus assembly protein CpaC